jgi:hypothetical protein
MAKIELYLIKPLKVDNGAFDFVIPLSYFPRLKKSAVKVDEASLANEPEVPFNFTCNLKSMYNFRQVCHPRDFEVTEHSLNYVTI